VTAACCALLVYVLPWLFAACVVGILFCTYQMRRNCRVLAFRVQLLDDIGRAAQVDRLHGHNDFKWRYEAFDAVTYDEMMRRFWRPLESFYPDRRFTRPRG
jgi:hypothetical protein